MYMSPPGLSAGSYFGIGIVTMKRLFLVFSLLLSMAASTVAVSAQVDGVEAPDIPETDIEGAQIAYSRMYSVDFMALMDDPDVDLETDMAAMMRSMSIQGIQFDSEDNAKAYVELSMDALDEAMESDPETMEGMEASELEGFDVDGIVVSMDMPDVGIAMTLILFVDGDQVFQISATDADVETSRATAESLVEYVLDNEVQTEEVTFNEDGTSTGGVFDRMPAADHELVGDLTSVTDMELMPPAGE